jgi:hypothetical protein
MPENHDKEKKPPKSPSEIHRKASQHLRHAAEHAEEAAKHFDSGDQERSQLCALKAHAQQLEATKHLNEAIKHQLENKKEHEAMPVGAGGAKP